MAEKTRTNPKGAGRKTVMTPDVLQKLEDAFMNAFTDEMACLYAGISTSAFYEYCEANPKFAERKETLKLSPNLLVQTKLVEDAKSTVGGARWWAERRMKEFMPITKLEHSGTIKSGEETEDADARAIAKRYEEELRQSIVGKRRKKATATAEAVSEQGSTEEPQPGP